MINRVVNATAKGQSSIDAKQYKNMLRPKPFNSSGNRPSPRIAPQGSTLPKIYPEVRGFSGTAALFDFH